MAPRPRMVSLTLSFSVFGALAAVFGLLGLGLFAGDARALPLAPALLIGAAAGAAYGLAVGIADGLRDPFASPRNVAIKLAVGLAATGAWAGCMIASTRGSITEEP